MATILRDDVDVCKCMRVSCNMVWQNQGPQNYLSIVVWRCICLCKRDFQLPWVGGYPDRWHDMSEVLYFLLKELALFQAELETGFSELSEHFWSWGDWCSNARPFSITSCRYMRWTHEASKDGVHSSHKSGSLQSPKGKTVKCRSPCPTENSLLVRMQNYLPGTEWRISWISWQGTHLTMVSFLNS
jgi:hypothetical protein